MPSGAGARPTSSTARAVGSAVWPRSRPMMNRGSTLPPPKLCTVAITSPPEQRCLFRTEGTEHRLGAEHLVDRLLERALVLLTEPPLPQRPPLFGEELARDPRAVPRRHLDPLPGLRGALPGGEEPAAL